MVIAVIDGNMIEVAYSTENDTNTGYTIRKAEGTGDISGNYNEYEKTQIEFVEDVKVILKGDDNNWSVATWSMDGYSYAIDCQNYSMTKDHILSLVNKIK